MSRINKVNPGQYHVAGRLTPDDAARERVKQRNVATRSEARPHEAGAPTAARAPGAREKGAAAAPAQSHAWPRTRAAGRSRG
jgi:hypothetical protein